MQNKNQIIILVLLVLIIIGAIWYLENKKVVELPSSASNITVVPVDSTATGQNRTAILAQKAQKYSLAKELTGNTGFINSDPFKIADLIGRKVILVDFWTYSCINCQRTIPYLEAWYQKYKDQGLVVVGVHSPEFDFEKDYSNVAKGVKAAGITYPVVLDSNMAIWNAYGNQYWPEEYLIDIDGYVVDNHIGEGDYASTEQKIQTALKERALVLGVPYTAGDAMTNPAGAVAVNAVAVQSPETYFGSARNEYLINGTAGVSGTQNLTLPASIQPDYLYLGGSWNVTPQYAESGTNSTIEYKYHAKNVYFVASSQNGVKIKIWLDGKLLDSSNAGKDVVYDSTVFVKDNKLYDLINGQDYGDHTLKIEVEGGILDAYTFTFG